MDYLLNWKCGIAISLIYFQVNSECFVLQSSTTNTINNSSDYLILTPYIENGQFAEARQASEVTNLPVIGNAFTSYSGFFTVNTTYNSNLFFWFIPPLNGDPDCPVLLWFQGGPGMSALNSIFGEHGPMQVDVNGTPSLRNITWNREFAMLYVDNPIGTGFSFTDNDLGYSRNQEDISTNLYSMLQQFFLVFSEYRDNAFFITGYSYACKYIVTLANLVHERNSLQGTLKINLRGLAIGSGFCTLRLEDNYADYLFQVGLIDQIQWQNFTAQQNEINYLIDTKQYLEAFNAADSLILGYLVDTPYQHNVTGQAAVSMLRNSDDYESIFYYLPYIAIPETRQAIHVGTRPFNNDTKVVEALEADIVQSISPAIESILNRNYPTLFFGGNVDILTSSANIENLLLNLDWKGASKFKQATQHIYRITNDTVAGYVRQADNLYYMVVRNAGHIVQFDQPEVALDMITRFVRAIVDCTNCDTNNKMRLFV